MARKVALTVTVDGDLIVKLDNLAEKLNTNVSSLVNSILKSYFEKGGENLEKEN